MKTLLAIIKEPTDSKSFIKYVANMAKDFSSNVHLLYALNTSNYPNRERT